ncbi:MAG: AAA family ATPase [Terrimicrobiaceae bacterium]
MAVEKLPAQPGKGRNVYDFKKPLEDDPNVLVGDRWLCRQSFALLVGNAGDGKSSLLLLLLICFAVGRPIFGFKPKRPLRVMLFQKENDEGDVFEEIAGILGGLKLTEEENRILAGNLEIHDDLPVGYEGLVEMAARANAFAPDLIGLDPLFGFLDCGVSDQRELSHFLRQGFWELLKALNAGAIVCHHVNKPPTRRNDSKDPTNWVAADASYAGSGSAELANAARAALHLRGLGDGKHFELRAGKRHQRLPWKVLPIQQCDGKIYWEETPEDERGQDCETGGYLAFLDALRLRDPKDGEAPRDCLVSRSRLEDACAAIKCRRTSYADLAEQCMRQGLLQSTTGAAGKKYYGTPNAVSAFLADKEAEKDKPKC